MTHLHRRCPDRNMARFYAMTIERSLFGHFMLVRCWGRIGGHGQTKSEWFDDETQAKSRRDQLDRLKRRRGYQEAFSAP
jgi:predicted DNA-binding WGR domain protein